MKRSHSIIGFVLLASIGYTQGAIAQVIPDATVGTIVSPGLVFNITGGNRPSNGPNLFHSFSQFSLPTGSSAIFQNDPTVQTIFSRVTGGSRSEIDGLIQTQGNASLFLMNPNGIVLGPNAKLELGGSFLGTTANGIRFEDGIEFNAGNVSANPLLSVKVPIGLQMGTNPGAITVRGSGHQLSSPNVELASINRTANTGGLRTQPGQTLALLGGEIALQGGMLTADGGRIELGAVQLPTFVKLTATHPGFQLDYTAGMNYGNIRLAQKTSVDVSGTPAGSIQVQGNQISLSEASVLLAQNQGSSTGGAIRVNATGTVTMSGVLASKQIRSGLLTEVFGAGTGQDTIVTTPQLIVRDGAGIVNRTFGSGNGGNIRVQASELVQVRDFNPANIFSGISSSTLAEGRGGNVFLSTPHLTVANGAVVGSVTYSRTNGAGGNLMVDADRIEVIGNQLPGATALSTASLISGKAGDAVINTQSLKVLNSGAITSASSSEGNAGNIQINATESVEVRGSASSSLNPSQIRSTVNTPNSFAQAFFKIPAMPVGAGGNVTITTPSLTVADRASITVRNQGIGNAGIITLNANSIRLDNAGSLTATTRSGEGGEILINSDQLGMRHGSFITADAGGIGKGGNLNIRSTIILGLENSDIIANAVGGRGGKINITTQGIIGLKFRNTLTPRTDLTNDITASSGIGLDGSIEIHTIGVDPNSGLTELPTDFVDASQKVSDRCAAAKTSSLVSTGRGGIPQSPIETHKAGRTWHDLRNTGGDRSVTTTVNPVITPIAQAKLVEASALRTNPDGSIDLVAPMPSAIDSGATCAVQ